MQSTVKKLVVIGLQQTFLQMVHDQITELTCGNIQVRTVSLNDLYETPLFPDETILYFSKGLKTIAQKMFPECLQYILARRENLIYNMRALFSLEPGRRILVVNDVKVNTDEMTKDLETLGLGQEFIPYYPEEALPEGIDMVVTAGERMLVPPRLKQTPIIDIGLRFISLETVYALFDHFSIPYTPAALARHYMRTMMMLSEKWPVLGEDRYRQTARSDIHQDMASDVTLEDLIQNSDAMKKLCRDAAKMAMTDAPIHLYGRIGTGKTLVSRAIHNASNFRTGPFISINCAARSPEVLERELFGWEDAATIHESLFETAENGTLCIEEIAKLPEKLQPGLLQAVSEKQIVRSNGSRGVAIHVRLITTSSQRLEKSLFHAFNSELLFLITQHVCRIPGLNERMADFEALIADYLENRIDNARRVVPEETLAILKRHPWQGNVQELYNVLQHLVCMSSEVLLKKNLPYYITKEDSSMARSGTRPEEQGPGKGTRFESITQDLSTHGFLAESRQILKIYQAGKKKNNAYGRGAVLALLQKKGIKLSQQQLRLKLERMDKLGLLIVRPGRGGTTISEKGELYLNSLAPGTL